MSDIQKHCNLGYCSLNLHRSDLVVVAFQNIFFQLSLVNFISLGMARKE